MPCVDYLKLATDERSKKTNGVPECRSRSRLERSDTMEFHPQMARWTVREHGKRKYFCLSVI